MREISSVIFSPSTRQNVEKNQDHVPGQKEFLRLELKIHDFSGDGGFRGVHISQPFPSTEMYDSNRMCSDPGWHAKASRSWDPWQTTHQSFWPSRVSADQMHRPLQTAKQWNLWWQWPTMIPASLEISWTFSVPGFGHRRSLSEYEYEYGKKAALLFMTKLSNYWGMEPQICSIAMSYNTGQKACSISRVQEFPNCGLTTTKAILSVKPFQSRGMNSVNLWINDSFRKMHWLGSFWQHVNRFHIYLICGEWNADGSHGCCCPNLTFIWFVPILLPPPQASSDLHLIES